MVLTVRISRALARCLSPSLLSLSTSPSLLSTALATVLTVCIVRALSLSLSPSLLSFSYNGCQEVVQRLQNHTMEVEKTLVVHTFLESVGLVAGVAYGAATGHDDACSVPIDRIH